MHDENVSYNRYKSSFFYEYYDVSVASFCSLFKDSSISLMSLSWIETVHEKFMKNSWNWWPANIHEQFHRGWQRDAHTDKQTYIHWQYYLVLLKFNLAPQNMWNVIQTYYNLVYIKF